MKKALLYYNFSYPIGGGEYLPLMLLADLQKTCDVTLACDLKSGLLRAMELFGVPLDLDRLAVVQLMPDGYTPARHTPLLSLRRAWRLKRLARHADICLSAANMIDFGKPGHHFMTMVAFGDDAFTAFARGDGAAEAPRPALAARLKRLVLDVVPRLLLGLRSKRALLADPAERIYPNSRYLDAKMRAFYGDFAGEIFFPPTLFEPGDAPQPRDGLQVSFIGRLSPEKRILDIIAIVERARARSGRDLKLRLAGPCERETAYIRAIKDLAATRPWLSLAGPKFGDAKDRFLRSGAFAIHAGTVETFGISVTEYLKAGNIALVPDDGGSREVVDSPELTYRTVDEGAQILARLLTDADFRERQARHCAARAQFFSRAAYLDRQRKLLDNLVNNAP